jgi:hypothetical protein
MFQATNQTFFIQFNLYMETKQQQRRKKEEYSLLGLWFTVLVCTRCCLQKMEKINKNISK